MSTEVQFTVQTYAQMFMKMHLFNRIIIKDKPLIHGQIILTHFLNQKLWHQIRCLHDQISLKQTNQISFKDMGPFRRLFIFPFTFFSKGKYSCEQRRI